MIYKINTFLQKFPVLAYDEVEYLDFEKLFFLIFVLLG